MATNEQMNYDNGIEGIVFRFEEGLPGFEQFKQFSLIEEDLNTPFGTLQSVDHPDTQFIIIDPFLFFKEYEFDLPDNVANLLALDQSKPLLVRAIVTIRGDLKDATINLVAPILLNLSEKVGKQVILSNTPYATRHPLFESVAER
jgi:flagellar assembly factor FliW